MIHAFQEIPPLAPFSLEPALAPRCKDVVDKQIKLGTPDLSAAYPNIGKPQIGTLSLAGNGLGFGNGSIVSDHRLNRY